MRANEFLLENKITLQDLYGGNFPDRDETFWDYVRLGELQNPLDIKTLPKYKLAIMLRDQYRVEHLDEILDMMDEDQKEILQRYINDSNLSKKIIVVSGDRIIDGNHRALAAAIKGVSINYVDLADLDEQDVIEGFDDEADAWREWQYKMLPRKMEMLSGLIKGWKPSKEDHIAAIEAGYIAIKNTGNVKDAARVISDKLKEIQRQQGVMEDTVDSQTYTGNAKVEYEIL